MLDPQLKQKLAKTYVRIGEIGYQLALNLRKGKDHSKKQEELYEKGIKILQYFKILTRHIDATTTPPTLYNITELQVNKMLRCIEKIGELDRIPVFPSALPNVKPSVIASGSAGTPGAPGADGTDANIIVEPAPGEEGIDVNLVEISGVKHYQLDLVPYIAPQLNVAIVGQKVFEVGVVVATIPVAFTTTKGSKSITSLTVDDATLNATLQGIISLIALNGVSQPVVNTPNAVNVEEDITFVGSVNDEDGAVQDSDTVNFYYPYLFGASTITGITHYTALTKLIQGKQTTEFTFNDSFKYFWIGCLSSYGTFKIYDNNELDVTSEFTFTLVNVTSVGLNNNWTIQYRIARTTDITEIIDKTFRIEFDN